MKSYTPRAAAVSIILFLTLLALPYLTLAVDPIPETYYQDTRDLGFKNHKEYLFLLPKGNMLEVEFEVLNGGSLDLVLIEENELGIYLGSDEYFRFELGSRLNTTSSNYVFESPKDSKYYFIVENSNRTHGGATSTDVVRYHIEFDVTKPEVGNAEEGGVCGTTVVMLSMLPTIGLVGFGNKFRKVKRNP